MPSTADKRIAPPTTEALFPRTLTPSPTGRAIIHQCLRKVLRSVLDKMQSTLARPRRLVEISRQSGSALRRRSLSWVPQPIRSGDPRSRIVAAGRVSLSGSRPAMEMADLASPQLPQQQRMPGALSAPRPLITEERSCGRDGDTLVTFQLLEARVSEQNPC